MESNEINKILEVYHSKDYSDKIIRWRDFLKVSTGDWHNLSNTWLPLDKLKEFDFVRDIINKDLQNIGYNDYRCAEFISPNKGHQGPITLLKYVKGDFITEHTDENSCISEDTLSGNYLLNDEFEGGDFIFDGEKLEKEVGELTVYGRDILHEVTTVTSGIRYSIHIFIDKV